MQNERVGQFRWPPKPAESGARGDNAFENDVERVRTGFIEIKKSKPAAQSEVSAFRTFEKNWLGLQDAPLAERALAAGFRPDEPGEYCTGCGRAGAFGDECAACIGATRRWDRIVRLGEYDDLPGRVARELKFERWRRAGADLGEWMGLQLASELRRAGLEGEDAVLIPSPMHWLRRLWRGIDHTMILANGASKTSGLPVRRWLSRRFRMPQGGLGGVDRRRNVRGTMSFCGEKSPEKVPQVLVIVDDVLTTGETMAEAADCVRRAVGSGWNGRIWGLVAAVSSDRGGLSGG